MLHRGWIAACVLGSSLIVGGTALAASPKTYQVTGPVLEMNSDMIVVKKGTDRWEIVRGASSVVPADVKVGDKVTITYRMTATKVVKKTK